MSIYFHAENGLKNSMNILLYNIIIFQHIGQQIL